MSEASDTTTGPTQRVDWRIPRWLEKQSERGEGVPTDEISEHWQDNLRARLARWAATGGRVELDPQANVTKTCSMYVETATVEAIERVRKQLESETGRSWSRAKVVRLICGEAK